MVGGELKVDPHPNTLSTPDITCERARLVLWLMLFGTAAFMLFIDHFKNTVRNGCELSSITSSLYL
jgi:hypothetical protein